ncbi:sugar kinase, ribokinase family [Longilinea arvoryzae]|uniref:Sugar kinase, ribokinase family n=1 Tax=Longilinea arvoryzae TaxID=360412 RepID=A0A0S7BF49_9CHLR|nr:sugar kinase [Longilinea arvoryzae]GAP12411.1 sugar kinase, ribokinase family [Longilinea arvoryzae]
MKQILCLGDACADIIIPYGAAKIGVDKPLEFSCGGTAANTASGLARLGAGCAFLGKAGDDFFGRTMKNALEKDGVDTKLFTLDKNLSSIMILAVIDENNDRFPFLMPRERPSHLQLYDADIPEGLLDQISFVHTTGLMLFEEPAAGTVCRFLEKCAGRGIRVSLDINLRIETLNRNKKYLYQALECTDYLLGSGLDEFVPLTGIGDPFKAARSLVTDKRAVVCRMGNKGSIAFDRLGAYGCGAFPVEVVDTLGAGDAYNSGFLWALSKEKDLQFANQAGCAAAAINITRQGARNCPDEKELVFFLQTYES